MFHQMMLAVCLPLAGCSKSPTVRVEANRATVQKVSPTEIVLAVRAKAGSKIWIEDGGGGAGIHHVPSADIETTVTYRIEEKGYSVRGAGETRNAKATDVVFHQPPVVNGQEIEIGTYSQWDSTRIPLRFKLE